MSSGESRNVDAAYAAIFDIVSRDEEASMILSEILWREGVQGIEELTAADGTVTLRSSFGITTEQTTDKLKSLLSPGSTASFQHDLRSDDLGKHVLKWSVDWVDTSVGETWRNFARDIEISDGLLISPAWQMDRVISETRPTKTVVIDPGPVFGMGDHPTTIGSLRLLEKHISRNASVLDVGCGSGILGIACLVLGAARAAGVDIAPACISVSRANAEANGVAERWSVSTDPLGVLNETFDVIAANILAPVLVSLAPDLTRLLRNRGIMVVSGVLEGRYDQVIDALSPLTVVDSVSVDGWVSLALTKM